jgi:hypothetical protein
MLSLSPATRIFVALQPVDRRAGFNRLHAHVLARCDDHLSFYALEGVNRERHRVEIPRQQMVQWVEPIAGWLSSALFWDKSSVNDHEVHPLAPATQ